MKTGRKGGGKMAERASMNTGRGMASHNDLTCDSVDLEHVDLDKSMRDNLYYIYEDNQPKQLKHPTRSRGFFTHEMKFYENNFRSALELQRETYAKNSQAKYLENCTMDKWYQSKKCEEQIYQYGNIDTESSKLPTAKDLFTMTDEQARWEADFLSYKHIRNENGDYEVLKDENGNPVRCENTKMVIMDLAVHMGEATPHVHVRKLYMYKDDNGNWQPGNATKCYQEAGIEVPYKYYDELYLDDNGNPECKMDDDGNELHYQKGPRKGEPMFKTVVEKHFEQIVVYRKDDNDQFIHDNDGNKIIDNEATKTTRDKADKQVKRINCEKSTWDAMRRKHWQDTLADHGFEVEREPIEPKTEVSKLADKLIDRYVSGKKVKINESVQVNIHKYRRDKAIETNKKAKELEQDIVNFETAAREKAKELVQFQISAEEKIRQMEQSASKRIEASEAESMKQIRHIGEDMIIDANNTAERIKTDAIKAAKIEGDRIKDAAYRKAQEDAAEEIENKKNRAHKAGYESGRQEARSEIEKIKSQKNEMMKQMAVLITNLQEAIRLVKSGNTLYDFVTFAKRFMINDKNGNRQSLYGYYKDKYMEWRKKQINNRNSVDDVMRKAMEFTDNQDSFDEELQI